MVSTTTSASAQCRVKRRGREPHHGPGRIANRRIIRLKTFSTRQNALCSRRINPLQTQPWKVSVFRSQ
jgi:hypothetical protein